jgi:hypothetical protein
MSLGFKQRKVERSPSNLEDILVDGIPTPLKMMEFISWDD